jgi:hypothetical protein
MSDPPDYESQSIPGLQPADRLNHSNKRKSNTEPITFFGVPCQIEFPFMTRLSRRVRNRSPRKDPAWIHGADKCNLICPLCLEFVQYLESSKRRVYWCKCGNVLLNGTHRLNRRDPTLSEWEKLVGRISAPEPFRQSNQ